ncbi:hypothetical protein GCM10009544_03410 [Streptomyces stramineus]|uniref:Novel STAND NTPase 1 domain-containing protein n=1 Tax=Streptomyces stramineus TaxID=173861 RepID=A0ABN0ZD46_9ACTN
MTADLLVRLDDRMRGGGPLMVVAPSEAGKSSLLRAGLLPALARGALPAAGSADWPRLLLTPTAHPLASLAARLADVTGADPPGAGSADAQTCGALLNAAGSEQSGSDRRARSRPIVVVDQLEELFTLCTSERERRDFLDVLERFTRADDEAADPAGLVVLGLRSDFYTPCTRHPWLRAALARPASPRTHGRQRAAGSHRIPGPGGGAGVGAGPGRTAAARDRHALLGRSGERPAGLRPGRS